MRYKIIVTALIIVSLAVVSVLQVSAFSDSTKDNPAKWKDGSKMYCSDLYIQC